MKRPLVVLGFLACAGGGLAGRPEAEQLTGKALVEELRKGGYVLYMRHPETNPDQADTDPFNLDNIKAQRQLSDKGRAQAKSVGEALRALKIPFWKTISSKFNRAVEAGRLIDVATVETSLDVSEGGLVVSPRENQRRAAALRRLLSTAPASGKNVLIVGHRPNLQDACGKEFGDAKEGEICVFKPLGKDGFQCVARVPTPESWTEWAKR